MPRTADTRSPSSAQRPETVAGDEAEQIRRKLASDRDHALVTVLAYSGPRREEVVFRLRRDDIGERAIGYREQKRVRFTPLLAPLAEDLREWFLALGRPEKTLLGCQRTSVVLGMAMTGNGRRRVRRASM